MNTNKQRFKYSPAQRLRVAGEFNFVYQAKNVISANWFSLHFVQKQLEQGSAFKPPDKYARLGIQIAKRFVRSAVLRNRFKRIARETFRTNLFNVRNIDIVIRGRRLLKPEDCSLAEKEIIYLFDKLLTKCPNLVAQSVI